MQEGGELPSKGSLVADPPLQAAMQASADVQGFSLSVLDGHAAGEQLPNGHAA